MVVMNQRLLLQLTVADNEHSSCEFAAEVSQQELFTPTQ
jgi:hypothetical protein